MIAYCMGEEVEAEASKLAGGEVMLLENTRFYSGETKNDEKLSAGLGRLADYFVMVIFVMVLLLLRVCVYV